MYVVDDKLWGPRSRESGESDREAGWRLGGGWVEADGLTPPSATGRPIGGEMWK